MPDATLLLLLDEVRGKTLKLLDGLSDDQARFRPAGMNNTILWHAGHAYVVNEYLTVSPLGLSMQLPAGWFDMFSWKSTPATVPAASWPRLADVVAALKEQLERHRAIVAGLSDAQLSAPPPGKEPTARPLRYSILHGLHDEANHEGEIRMLRKLQGLRG
jgi:hypothetical protein